MKFFLGALAVAFAAYIVMSTSGSGGSTRAGAAAQTTKTSAPATVTTTTTVPAPEPAAPPVCPAAVNVGSTNSEAVRGLQRALRGAGHAVAVDGVYGPDTLSAVRAVKAKSDQKLADDGLVNDAVWRALETC